MTELRPGWFERQSKAAAEEIRRWPEQMRENHGVQGVNNTNFYTLFDKVKVLHASGAMHKKRGFSLKDATALLATNHLIEETAEFQAEIIVDNKEAMLTEASDVLAVYLHALHLADISVHDVIDKCMDGLVNNFTLDPNELLTTTPGFNRSNRQ